MYKYIKKYQEDIVYGGLPLSSVDSIKKIINEKGYTLIEDNESKYEINGIPSEKDNYHQWVEKVRYNALCKMNVKNNTEMIKETTDLEVLINEIKNFSLAHKTPIEALQFIAYIQEKLKQYGTLL